MPSSNRNGFGSAELLKPETVAGVEHELDPVGVGEGTDDTLIEVEVGGALDEGGGGGGAAVPGRHCLRSNVRM